MLPPTCTGMPLDFKNVAGQRGCGGLAVRAGDADDFALEEPACQFQIADDPDAAPAGACDDIEIRGNAGRQHDEIGIRERGFAFAAQRTSPTPAIRDRILIHCAHVARPFRAAIPPPPRRCAPCPPPRLLLLQLSSILIATSTSSARTAP